MRRSLFLVRRAARVRDAPTDPGPLAASAVAIGNFDAVHLGHRVVLDALFLTAASLGVPTCVYTFDPAPTAVVAPERHQARIQTLPNRVASLEAAGVDFVVVQPFTHEFASLSAERFVESVLRARLGARALVVGHDFRFGSRREGDAATLRRLAPEVQLVEVPALVMDGAAVSSSRVRKFLAVGDVEAAAALLGRTPLISGIVTHGDGRGRTLGFPTANVQMEEELRPGAGVYAVLCVLDDGRRVAGVANLGTRPTVNGVGDSVEVHLFDFAEDLYGRRLDVGLVARLRDERRFASLAELTAQIRIDAAAARERLG